ncbi:MAG: Asp-tRNA(Asn)/Glu-tRNA(Gln) amidotransferase GatCAB subunit B [Nitrospiraceae bacterium]|nr:Asp-tRNA(Asn)/Glu-tRNA(Gln) amidotransferase GatCAB subunit B [Nitrospiraceae bacterium]
MPAYEVVIGLEVHAQLRTRSKLFCGCSTAFGAKPNTQTCPVCLGLPGVLPVLNMMVVEMAVRTGLALNCTITTPNQFARKNYFYPDLPKGYQISQFDRPICQNGWLEIDEGSATQRVCIRRAHLEEDAGKNIHQAEAGVSHVDVNRCGMPLLEIVTEPDLRSSDGAVAYLKTLRDILLYLDVCDGNMEEGSLRCEPNISLRLKGQDSFGTKVELKNINSFKFVKHALDYEIQRQETVLADGGTIDQETRSWDAERGVSVVMRSKEEAHDYRYFPEPDLMPIEISPQRIDILRLSLPELPEAKRNRFIAEYKLPAYDAVLLTSSRPLADYFEACVAGFPNPKTVSNWIMGELLHALKNDNCDVIASPMKPDRLIALMKLVDDQTISLKTAREVFLDLFRSQQMPKDFIQEHGLMQISDDGTLDTLIDEIVHTHPKQCAEYQSGKDNLLGFFVGQVMKASKGKANPQKVNTLMRQRLMSENIQS